MSTRDYIESIAEMRYMKGMTLAQIGSEFDVSRERIRQLLAEHYPDKDAELRESRKPPMFICELCGEESVLYHKGLKYCSIACFNESRVDDPSKHYCRMCGSRDDLTNKYRCRKCNSECTRRVYRRSGGKEKGKERQRKEREDPQKLARINAMSSLNAHLRYHNIRRPTICSMCRTHRKQIRVHIIDASNPYRFIYVCPVCSSAICKGELKIPMSEIVEYDVIRRPRKKV